MCIDIYRYIYTYILPASLLLMKPWDLVSISWFYCDIVFGAGVPEVTQTNPLRANTGLCFLFTRVNAVLFGVTGPTGSVLRARCIFISPATPETPEHPPSTLHRCGEEDPVLTGKAAPVGQTWHIHCLRLWLFFCVCR